MKNFYIILILFFSFAIFSCAKKSDTSSTNDTTAPTVTSVSTTQIIKVQYQLLITSQ